eukprot:10552217-Lingulodinium_polyedra.AAC.1
MDGRRNASGGKLRKVLSWPLPGDWRHTQCKRGKNATIRPGWGDKATSGQGTQTFAGREAKA